MTFLCWMLLFLAAHIQTFVACRSHITVPDVLALAGDDAVINCWLEFDEPEDNDLVHTIVLTKTGKHRNEKCILSKWQACPPMTVLPGFRPHNFSCGCLARRYGGREYIFYLYIREVSIHFQMSQFMCHALGSKEEVYNHGILTIIDFSLRPDAVNYRCEGENLTLPWEYNPFDHEKYFEIESVEWTFLPEEGDPIPVGSFVYDKQQETFKPGDEHFLNRAMVYQVRHKHTIPKLSVNSLSDTDGGRYRIQVKFKPPGIQRERRDLEDPKLLDPFLNIPVEIEEEDNTTSNITFDLPEPVKLGVVQPMMPLVPSTFEVILRQHQPVLSDSVQLIIAKPPGENAIVKFEVHQKWSTLYALCVLQHNAYRGIPPVSLIIKHKGQILKKATNVSRLYLEIPVSATPMNYVNYTCGLEGRALLCERKSVNTTHKIAIENLLDISIIQDYSDDYEYLKKWSIIFTIEGFIASVFILWTCTLCLKHARFVCSQKKIEMALKLYVVENRNSLQGQTITWESEVSDTQTEGTNKPDSIY